MAAKPMCLNCIDYGWKCSIEKVLRCKRCKLASYCSSICQSEHWLKVHHNHCKYLAGIKVCQNSFHTARNCLRCKAAKKLAPNEYSDPNSGVYPCVFSDWLPDPFFSYKKNKDKHEKQIILYEDGGYLPFDLGEISQSFSCHLDQSISVVAHICLKLTHILPACKKDMEDILYDLAALRQLGWIMRCTKTTKSYERWFAQAGGEDIRKIFINIMKSCHEFMKTMDLSPLDLQASSEGEVRWWQSLLLFLGIAYSAFCFSIPNNPHREELKSSIQPALDLAS